MRDMLEGNWRDLICIMIAVSGSKSCHVNFASLLQYDG
jgi:hypothetical protein